MTVICQMEYFPFLAHVFVFTVTAITLMGILIWYLLFRVWVVKNRTIRAVAMLGASIGGTLVEVFVIVGYLGW